MAARSCTLPNAMSNELVYMSMTDMATALRAGKVTSVALVKAHLDHIEAHNNQLNALVQMRAAQAMAEAQKADELLAEGADDMPLLGVPITVKESFEVEGLPTTVNFFRLKNYRSTRTALAVQRLQAAGAVVMGKSSVPMLLGDYQTYGDIYPRVLNPYDVTRTPGGSSGGGAAAVAAGFSPMDLATDLAGSIRLPAHFCGLFALKPTYGTVSPVGHIPPIPGRTGTLMPMMCFGPIARTLADVALVHQVVAGRSNDADTTIPPIDWLQPQHQGLAGYRVAWSDHFAGISADAATIREVDRLMAALTLEVASTEKINPPGLDVERSWKVWGNLFGMMVTQDTHWAERLGMRFMVRGWKGTTIKASRRALGGNFMRYAKALNAQQQLTAVLEAFFQDYDIFICPVSPTPAFAHQPSGKYRTINGVRYPYFEACGVFLHVFNVTGHPALVVPLGHTEEGLPIGVQLVGPLWSEPVLFHFAQLIQGHLARFRVPNPAQWG